MRGTEIRQHLTGGTLDYWFYLWGIKVDMQDWDRLKSEVLSRFCGLTKAEFLRRLEDIKWKGHPVQFAGEFFRL